MPSSTSNFKRILRLPRLFFRQPTEAESVHGGPPLEFERPIPQIPWRGITVVVVVVVIAAASAWEFYCRFRDKDWSFTDCTSKVVMESLDITTAFSFDQHFRQFSNIIVVP